jgi:hypothetical protein
MSMYVHATTPREPCVPPPHIIPPATTVSPCGGPLPVDRQPSFPQQNLQVVAAKGRHLSPTPNQARPNRTSRDVHEGGIVPQIARNRSPIPHISPCIPKSKHPWPVHQSLAAPQDVACAQMKLDMKREMGSDKPSTRCGRHWPAAPHSISQRRLLGAAQAFRGGSSPRPRASTGPVFLIARLDGSSSRVWQPREWRRGPLAPVH